MPKKKKQGEGDLGDILRTRVAGRKTLEEREEELHDASDNENRKTNREAWWDNIGYGESETGKRVTMVTMITNGKMCCEERVVVVWCGGDGELNGGLTGKFR